MLPPIEIPRIDVELASREALVNHILDLEFLLSSAVPSEVNVVRIRRRLRIKPTEARIISALLTGRVCTNEYLRTVAGISEEIDDVRGAIAVRIHFIRKAIEKTGAKIANVYGTGFVMEPSDIKLIKEAIAEHAA